MSIDLAKLVVTLEAQTAKYMAAMEAAQAKLAKFSKSNTTAATAIGTAFASVGISAARGLFEMAKAALDNADQLNKLAQSTGVSTEALSQLQYAADLSGISTDELASSLGRLAKQASEAASGSKEQVQAFDRLGVSVTGANGELKGTEELLGEVADAFTKLTDSNAKSALATDIFGKAMGPKLIPFLNQGSAGLAALREEADALGLTLKSSTAAAAEEFNDNLTRIQRTVGGLVNRFVEEALPALSVIADGFVKSAKDGGLLAVSVQALAVAFKTLVSAGIIVKSVFQQLGLIILGVGEALFSVVQGKFKQALSDLTTRFSQVKNNATSDFESIGNVWTATANAMDRPARQAGDAVKIVSDEAEKARKSIEQVATSMQQQISTFDLTAASAMRYRIEQGDLAASFQLLGESGEALKQKLLGLAEIQSDIETRTAAAAKAEENAKQVREEGRQVTESVIGPLEQYIATTERLNYLLEQGVITERTAAQAMQDAADARDNSNRSLQDAKALYESTMTPAEQYFEFLQHIDGLLKEGAINQETYNRAVAQAKDSFDKAVQGTQQGASELQGFITQALTSGFQDGAKGILRGFVQMLLQMQAQALAAKLVQSLFGAASGGNPIAGALTSAIGGTRSTGGDVTAGREYMVGERGPERFVPDVNGSIISNDKVAPQVTVSPQIINVKDPSEIPAAIQSSGGQDAIMNVIGKNASTIRTLLQG